MKLPFTLNTKTKNTNKTNKNNKTKTKTTNKTKNKQKGGNIFNDLLKTKINNNKSKTYNSNNVEDSIDKLIPASHTN